MTKNELLVYDILGMACNEIELTIIRQSQAVGDAIDTLAAAGYWENIEKIKALQSVDETLIKLYDHVKGGALWQC